MVCIKFHATTAASFLLVIQFWVQIQCKELNLLAGLFDTMGNLLHPRDVRDLYELKTVTTIVKSHLFFDWKHFHSLLNLERIDFALWLLGGRASCNHWRRIQFNRFSMQFQKIVVAWKEGGRVTPWVFMFIRWVCYESTASVIG